MTTYGSLVYSDLLNRPLTLEPLTQSSSSLILYIAKVNFDGLIVGVFDCINGDKVVKLCAAPHCC